MVPKVAGSGGSFQGAGQYYLHDKKKGVSFKGAAEYALEDKGPLRSAERVEFTQTLNLPTDDPERAIAMMIWTATHQDELKVQAGGKNTGRKLEHPVYAYSLSWHPEEQPDKEHMLRAGIDSLKALGMDKHQTLIVCHNDEPHPHIHLIVNRVHPVTGKAASLSNDRLKLSRWAEAYEKERGKIYCDKRVEHNQKREQGEFVKAWDDPLTALYRQAKSGRDFAEALEKEGYLLAKGDRRDFVIVDEYGKVRNPAKLIEGASAQNIRDKLADIDLRQLPSVKEAIARQEKEALRSEWANRERAEQQNRHLDERRAMDHKHTLRRQRKEKEIDDYYDREKPGLERRIAALKKELEKEGLSGVLQKIGGGRARLEEEIFVLQQTLASGENRRGEAWGRFNKQCEDEKQALLERQRLEDEQLEASIAIRTEDRRLLEQMRERQARQRDRQRQYDGPERKPGGGV